MSLETASQFLKEAQRADSLGKAHRLLKSAISECQTETSPSFPVDITLSRIFSEFAVGVGRSDDNPNEPALVIYVEKGKLQSPLPAEIDGIRTKIVEGERFRAFDWGRETTPRPVCRVVRTKSSSSFRVQHRFK